MNNLSFQKIKDEKSYKDVFGAYLLEGAEFDLDCGYDIPFTNVPNKIDIPDQLVSYEKIDQKNMLIGKSYCHFYLDDYKFDGTYGVWNTLVWNRYFQKGFNINKLKNIDGIICPDYSNYNDMPKVMQIWNVYRSRAVGYFFNSRGLTAIPNVRWTDESSYIYAFAGLKKGSVVAVSTLGCLRNKIDNKLFMDGLEELIKRINPSIILIYGNVNESIIKIFTSYNQNYKVYPSDISLAYKEKLHGNEG